MSKEHIRLYQIPGYYTMRGNLPDHQSSLQISYVQYSVDRWQTKSSLYFHQTENEKPL